MEKSIKELIKRDTPMETYVRDGWFICPSCGEVLSYGEFCRFCGQRISYKKWEEEVNARKR